MRTTCNVALFAAAVLGLAANAEPFLTIGAESVNITFENTDLSDVNRAAITGDIARVLSFNVPMRELFDFDHPVNDGFAINEIAPSVFSRAILTGLVCNVSANLETSLLVRTSLSSAYMEKYSSLSVWTNAITSLEGLITDLNTGVVTNYPNGEKMKLLALESGSPTLEMVNASMDGIVSNTFYHSSILDYVIGFNWAGHTNCLATLVRTVGQGEPVSSMHSVPVIYEDGAWKFIISE